MDLVYQYLGLAAWWGIVGGLALCFLILLGYMLWNKQWLYFLISILFLPACFSGTLIPLVIGWQEEKNWKIPKLIRIYSVLVVLGFFILSHQVWVGLTTREEPVDEKTAKYRAKMKGKGMAPPPVSTKGTSAPTPLKPR